MNLCFWGKSWENLQSWSYSDSPFGGQRGFDKCNGKGNKECFKCSAVILTCTSSKTLGEAGIKISFLNSVGITESQSGRDQMVMSNLQ